MTNLTKYERNNRSPPQFEKFTAQNCYLSSVAKDAYRSFTNAYASHSMRSVFEVQALDLVQLGNGFGFSALQRVDITVGSSTTRGRKHHRWKAYGCQLEAKRRGVTVACQ